MVLMMITQAKLLTTLPVHPPQAEQKKERDSSDLLVAAEAIRALTRCPPSAASWPNQLADMVLCNFTWYGMRRAGKKKGAQPEQC